MTNSWLKRDSSVMMSSTMPSAKYSCSASPDMFAKGSTAIEVLAARAGASRGLSRAAGVAAAAGAAPSASTR